MKREGGIAYRAAGSPDAPVVLLLHGYPESSYMWRHLMPAIADAGWRAIAPDFPGFGDSPADPPGTWERHVDALERFRSGLGIATAALLVHDWGGLIGLRWACDHADAVSALVISGSGFFPDGRWHGVAQAMRTEGTGEELVEGMTRDSLGGFLRQAGAGFTDDAIDEYWKAFGDADRRRGQLELYRSGDFEKLEAYDGKLAALGVPALLLWGENDAFAPVGGAHRFRKQLPGAELVVVDGAGHFVFEEAPERCADAVTAFLAARISASNASSR